MPPTVRYSGVFLLSGFARDDVFTVRYRGIARAQSFGGGRRCNSSTIRRQFPVISTLTVFYANDHLTRNLGRIC